MEPHSSRLAKKLDKLYADIEFIIESTPFKTDDTNAWHISSDWCTNRKQKNFLHLVRSAFWEILK